MNFIDNRLRPELLDASDEQIEDAVKHTDVMMLRGLLYQLTGDSELKSIAIEKKFVGYALTYAPTAPASVAMIHRKAAAFLKRYRDRGAGAINIGPRERLPESLRMIVGHTITDEDMPYFVEELALDPWLRSLAWHKQPSFEQLADHSVTVIGAGLGGLNAAMQLKRAGIPFTMFDKNPDVGGTWYENRYPGARLDTPSRGYTHLCGVDFIYPYTFCPSKENKDYLDWLAETFALRDHIQFDTEVHSLTWIEQDGVWEIRATAPDGDKVVRTRYVFTAVGFLNRPNIPDFPGAAEFRGPTFHTARWPDDLDWRGKRIAVIGTGATGYQLVPELALEAEHLTVIQRTPQWVFATPNYRTPLPQQVNWLDRNFPFHTNFMRFRTMYRSSDLWNTINIDPEFEDPHARSAGNKLARDTVMEFMHRKIADPELIERLTPKHPVLSARPIVVDPEYSFLDAVQRDNVTLVSSGVRRTTATGVETEDGTHHEVDIIVYATGFLANDYLYPMKITGRDGKSIDELWADDGARAYLGCLMPGFPNLWSGLGPNTNGALHLAGLHELTTLHAMRCIEKAMIEGKRSVEVKDEAYWRYNTLVDEQNNQKVWSDPRAQNYYRNKHGRSATQNPFESAVMWRMLREPVFADLEFR